MEIDFFFGRLLVGICIRFDYLIDCVDIYACGSVYIDVFSEVSYE